MFSGVAVALSEFSESLVEAHGLRRRVHARGGEPEVRFLLAEADRLLPAWLDGRLQILPWGSRRGQCPQLPATAWAREESFADGRVGDLAPEPVLVPADLVLDNGVWYRTRQGIRGVALRDVRGVPVVYPLVEPSTHYYQIMTRSPWMPALVGEVI
jgi:hypothetical protein